MDNFEEIVGMIPYPIIFPDTTEGVTGLSLPRKVGKAKAGTYAFVEAYCVEKGCDCRRAAIFVVAEKGKTAAVIDFGFDPDHPLAGPCLNELEKQTAGARDLLQIFVDGINDNQAWLSGMYDRYRRVREKVDGKKYRGKAFPKPGSVVRAPQEAPDLFQDLFSMFKGGVGELVPSRNTKAGRPPQDLLAVIEELSRQGWERFDDLGEQDAIVRERLLRQPGGIDELIAILPRIIPRNEREEPRMETALALLRTLLETLRVDGERQRQGAAGQMKTLQESLARHIFAKGADLILCAQITRLLIDCRVDILPLLRDANRAMIFGAGESQELSGVPAIGPSLGTLLRKSGCSTPFDAVELLLDLIILLDAEIQISLVRDLLDSRDSFVRDTAALLVFHPQAEVRENIAGLLASGTVRPITPETLRRLIISRNWFPEGMKKQIDGAIATARRGGVVCARLAPPTEYTVRASTIDGAGAQSFFVIIAAGKKRTVGNVLWKQGHGIIDSFLRPTDKKELNRLLDAIPDDLTPTDSAPWFLDRIVCHALAAGNEGGKPPHLGLLQVAEALGCDRWKAERIEPLAELAAIRRELEQTRPSLLHRDEAEVALSFSGDWPSALDFATTWFEDDRAVDNLLREGETGKRRISEKKLVGMVLDRVLEPRRGQWLERLTLMTLWLRAAAEPPIPWHEMFHVAEKLASGAPLKTIPLMVSVADESLEAARIRVVEDIF